MCCILFVPVDQIVTFKFLTWLPMSVKKISSSVWWCQMSAILLFPLAASVAARSRGAPPPASYLWFAHGNSVGKGA